jgi:hypothetical protein
MATTRLDYDSPAGALQRGRELYELRRYAEARSFFEKALRDSAKAPSAHRAIGFCELALRRFPEASAAFRESLAIREDVQARYGLACVYVEVGDGPAAVKELRKVLAAEPDHAPSQQKLPYALLASLSASTSSPAEDRAVEDELFSMWGKTVKSCIAIARSYQKGGKDSQARRVVGDALVDDPLDPELLAIAKGETYVPPAPVPSAATSPSTPVRPVAPQAYSPPANSYKGEWLPRAQAGAVAMILLGTLALVQAMLAGLGVTDGSFPTVFDGRWLMGNEIQVLTVLFGAAAVAGGLWVAFKPTAKALRGLLLAFGIVLVVSTVFGIADVALAYDRLRWAREASEGEGTGALLFGVGTDAVRALLPESKPTYAGFVVPQLFALASVWFTLLALHRHLRLSQPAW